MSSAINDAMRSVTIDVSGIALSSIAAPKLTLFSRSGRKEYYAARINKIMIDRLKREAIG
jgi:hypothetical protein